MVLKDPRHDKNKVQSFQKLFLQEETNSIVTDNILESSVGTAAKIVKESLRDDQQTELTEGPDRFYPYPNELNLETLTVQVTAPLKTYIDMIYSKSRSETAKKERAPKDCRIIIM